MAGFPVNHQVSGLPLALKVDVVSPVLWVDRCDVASDHTFIKQKYFTEHWISNFDHNTWHPLRPMAKVLDVRRITNCNCSSICFFCHDSSSSVTAASGLCLADLGATSPVWSSISLDSAALLDSSRSMNVELSCTATGNGAILCGC